LRSMKELRMIMARSRIETSTKFRSLEKMKIREVQRDLIATITSGKAISKAY
jgi:hypothetical protein